MRINLNTEVKFLIYIYQLSLTNNTIKSKDLASEMVLSKAAVSMALKKLVDKNLIEKEYYGTITLSENGNRIAKSIYDKHLILKHYFSNILLLDNDIAYSHSIVCLSTFEADAMHKFVENIKKQLDF